MIEGIKDRLIMREWVNFQQVHNEGGTASCQKDMDTFFIMRGSQFAPWSQELMESWYDDLAQAEGDGRNSARKKGVRRKRTPCFFSFRTYAEMEASFFASFAFLFAALFLCRMPLLAAESIAETVSG